MSVTPLAVPESSEVDNAPALNNIPPFHDLPGAVHDLLHDNSDRRQYDAGQTVFSLGQYDGSEFFVILSGAMRVSLIDAETGAMMVEDFGANSVFGLEVVLTNKTAEDFQRLAVTAEEDLDLIAVNADSFRTLAAGRPSLMRNIALHFASELSTLRFKTMNAQAAPEQRVFAILLECIERDPINGDWRIEKMPKHRELADRAGVEESETADAVATLIQEGIAKRDYPGLIITDMQRLNQLAI